MALPNKNLGTLNGADLSGASVDEVPVADGSGNLAMQVVATVPSGAITMHDNDGASLPSGYVLCDGNNGTPDLRGGYVKAAAGTGDEGTTGGANTVTLTTGEIPGHDHVLKLHAGRGSSTQLVTQGVGTTPDATSSGPVNSTGGGGAHQNEPAFTELRYMMKT